VQLELPLQDPVLQFTLLLSAALVVQVLLRRIGLPGLLGLLIVGMLVGPGGMAVVPREPVVELLGEIGLLFVMFIAGFEIDLRIVSRHRRETAVFGLLAFASTGVPAAIAGLLMGFSPMASVLLGALISSHTLLAYPVLLRLGLLKRLSVMTAVGGTLLTDTLALLILAVVITPGLAEGLPFGWLLPLVLLAILGTVSLWGVPRLADYFFSRSWSSRVDRALFALVILLLLAMVAELIGTEAILGAFLAGIALNRALAAHEALREHLEFVGRVLLIPFFFLWTGTLLEFDVLVDWPGVWGLAGLLLGLVVAGKAIASWVTGAFYGYSPLDRWLMVGLTIPQAAATLAITITAHEAGIFGEEVVDSVIIVILFSCLLGTVLTGRIGRRLQQDPDRSRGDPTELRGGRPR
jgi:Kef-type K+ transport system membrane component KefB